MKVLMIGGTGLLGSAAAQIFVDRGNEIKTLALPPLPEGAPLPKEMEIVFQDANKLSDDEMVEMMKGSLLCQAHLVSSSHTGEITSLS